MRDLCVLIVFTERLSAAPMSVTDLPETIMRKTSNSRLDSRVCGSSVAVEVVSSYAGVSRIAVDALVEAGVQGIVVAGTGNGSLHALLQQALAEAVQRGVTVVRSARVGSGHVMRNGAAPDDQYGFVSAGNLHPFKARVLLMLALQAGVPSERMQSVFDEY